MAKEGYLNLYLKSSKKSGDEKEMVKAREYFLSKDYYAFLKEKLNTVIKEHNTKTLVDLGCGEGYYTSFFECEDKIGIDLSKETLKKASRKDKKTLYILSSIFNTPLPDECADTVLTCFAPVAGEEIARILKKEGIFILVRPDRRHLYELKKAVYESPYENEDEEVIPEGFKLIEEYHIRDEKTLNNEELRNLFMMTPYYHTTSPKDKEKLNSIEELSVNFEFIISVLQRIPE